MPASAHRSARRGSSSVRRKGEPSHSGLDSPSFTQTGRNSLFHTESLLWQRREPCHFPHPTLLRKEVVSVSAREKVLVALCVATFSEVIRLFLHELVPTIVRALLDFQAPFLTGPASATSIDPFGLHDSAGGHLPPAFLRTPKEEATRAGITPCSHVAPSILLGSGFGLLVDDLPPLVLPGPIFLAQPLSRVAPPGTAPVRYLTRQWSRRPWPRRQWSRPQWPHPPER